MPFNPLLQWHGSALFFLEINDQARKPQIDCKYDNIMRLLAPDFNAIIMTPERPQD
jgi:hypothetical protein